MKDLKRRVAKLEALKERQNSRIRVLQADLLGALDSIKILMLALEPILDD